MEIGLMNKTNSVVSYETSDDFATNKMMPNLSKTITKNLIKKSKKPNNPLRTLFHQSGKSCTDCNPRVAVDLTTAKFRMLVNAEDYARPFVALVDNNLPCLQYSQLNIINHFNEIDYKACDIHLLIQIIDARLQFKQQYFNDNYCLYPPIKDSPLQAPLLLYRLSNNPKITNSIDKVIQWFPIFQSTSSNTNVDNEIAREKKCFESSLKFEFRALLLEYYIHVDLFENKLIQTLISSVEQHIDKLVDCSLDGFGLVSEVCKKCGESFSNKTDLINHHDYNACRSAPIHRCQCGELFKTHQAWHEHCFQPNMSCSTFSWHIWRHMISNTNSNINRLYICDGCQHSYTNFICYWHHLCFCPFHLAYMVGNCPQCTLVTKQEFYNNSHIQDKLMKPHADCVGIQILIDWANITHLIPFQITLSQPTEVDDDYINNSNTLNTSLN